MKCIEKINLKYKILIHKWFSEKYSKIDLKKNKYSKIYILTYL